MNESLQQEIRSLLESGRKLQAVKRYREQTGVGLADAKDAVESLGQAKSFPEHAPSDDSEMTRQLIRLLERGEKLKAVKLYRNRFGGGLKDAREAVQRIGEQNGIPSHSGFGCFGVILLAVAIGVAQSDFIGR